MKKVLLIDPRGIGSNGNYTKGLINGLLKCTEMSVATNYHFQDQVNKNDYPLYRYFFKYSEPMKQNAKRKIIRGIEYYFAYEKIIRLLKKEKFDVVHINWLLMYNLDIKFLQTIKAMGIKIVYTAHNVLPHVNGKSNIDIMRRIYGVTDRIIVHGDEVRKEFVDFFPEFKNKLYVQKHGCNCVPMISYDEELVPIEIIRKLNKFDRRFIFFGNIFYNKGTDLLLNFWANNTSASDTLLIVAGRKQELYKELETAEQSISGKSNVLYLDHFIDDNLLNYLISKSELILLPYRHASMSGVVFTAADFAKPILCTSAGALTEYLKNNEDSFISSDLEHYSVLLEKCLHESSVTFERMGKKLQNNIYKNCNWETIVNDMALECY